MGTEIERTYLAPETRADAIRYLTRTGNADVLEALGLVVDPVAAERSAAKARAMLNGHGPAPRTPSPARRGYCPICNNKLPGYGVCRRSKQCREAAQERGEEASPYACPVHHTQLRWGNCAECRAGGAQ